ncbi:hypothetical protein CEW46_28660, partial [Bacillus cereus]
MIGYYGNVDTDKPHYVIWSGGCDSTLILAEVARKYGSVNNPIKSISLQNPFIANNKLLAEQRQRDSILGELKKRGLHIQNTTISFSEEGDHYYPQQNGLPQAFLWIAQSLIYVGSDNIHFGYIRTDDFWQFKNDVLRAIDALGDILGTNPRVNLPLQYSTKSEIIKELKAQNLYHLIWYCESPITDEKPCYNCTPCRTHMGA